MGIIWGIIWVRGIIFDIIFPAPGCGIAIETKNIGVGGRRGFDCGSRRTANLGGDRLIRTHIIILEG